MSGLDPVPRPPVEPSGAGRAVPEPKRPKWLVPVIAGGTAVVVLAAGGIGGYLYWNHNRLTEASGECATSYGKAVKARKKLTEYLESDALKAAISVKGSEVRDAETVAVLASTVKTAEQAKTDIPGCPSGNLKGIRAAAARLDRAAAAYAKTMDEVRGKADAVNDSIKAKSDADAKAAAEKEAQAAGNTAQAPDNGSPYTGDTTGGHTGYTGGGYTQSQGGGYTYTPQQPAGNGGGYTPAPQPAPQPTPQPPQGNNGGGSGGDDGYEDMCFVYPTDGSPSYQVPCS